MAGNELKMLGTELENVSDKVSTVFEREDTFYSQLEKRPVEVVSARDMRFPLEMRSGGKFGYVDIDGGDLGRGDTPTFDKAVISTQNVRFAVEMTAKQLWATDSERKARVNSFKRNLATSMEEFRRQVDGQCMTDGTGVIGTITSVATAGGVDTYTLSTDGFRAKLMRFGSNINVFNAALTICRTGGGMNNEVSIVFMDLANNQIKVSPSVVGAVAGDVLVPSGLQNTPPVSILGIKYHNSSASTGTWMGFDRALNPEIRSSSVNANSSALTLPLPRLAINKIGDRLGKDARKGLKAWTHPAQIQAYEELGFNTMRVDKQSNSDEGLNLYFNGVKQLAGAPLMESYNWDRTRIDFLGMDTLGRAELHPCGFYKNPENGQYVFDIRANSGGVATSWIFYIVGSFNVFCTNPAALSYVYTLAVPSGY